MKKFLSHLTKATLLLLVMLVFVQANAQKRYAPLAVGDVQYTIENDVQVSPTELQFDLYLKDTDATNTFELSIVQAGILVNTSIINGGTITTGIVAGYSELVSVQQPATALYGAYNTSQFIIKMTPKTGPGCGAGTTISTNGLGTRVARIKIVNTVPFAASSQASLAFCFTTSPYPTKVFEYISCVSTQVTTAAANTHTGTTYQNIVLNPPPPPTAFAVTGGGAYCQGGAGMPVGLAGSQTGVTYTLYQGVTPLTPTYAGTGAAIPMGVRPGNFTYTVKGTGPGGTTDMTGSAIVTINPLPVITFAPLANVCVGSGNVTLTATPAGGVFSGPFVTGNQFNASTVGVYNITYNYTDPITGCAAAPVTQPISVIICTPTWSGLVNSTWSNPGNWLGNNVPLATGDAIIPAGCPNYPVLLTGTTTLIHNLDINGPGIKSALSGGMTISGVLIVGGNLTIGASGSLDITGGGALTIDGNLTITGSMLVETQGSLITNGTVTGTATVQRAIATNLGWHLLSSPVGNQAICNGVFAPTLASFPGDITTWDFYKWLPNCPVAPYNEHWRNLRTATGTLNTTDFGAIPAFEVTKGYLAAYGVGLPATKSFVGTPNTGDKTYSFADVITACSWTLVGNPYPSAIDWNQVTGKASNLLSQYYYVWNENKSGGAGYEYWKDGGHLSSSFVNGYIPAMQGFFLYVSPTGSASLGLPNSARVHDVLADHWLKDAQANKLTIQLSNGTNYDEAFVMFENNSTTSKDQNDAEKLFSMATAVPQVYTLVDNDQKISLNSMPYVTNGTTIPVGIVAPAEGNYSITVKGIENFSSLNGLSLEDLKLNYTQNLMVNPVYNFSATANEDAGRFLLHFAGPIGMNDLTNSTINIYSNEKTVFVTCAAGFRNATVTVSNLLGQEILTQKLGDQSINQVKVNALKGYYIVKVQDESSVKTAKVYIN
jgi:hypothetical protein